MKCNICTTENVSCFSGKLLDKYDIDYFYCARCGFLQTEEPYWLEEAYCEPINKSDTGYLVRNLSCSKKLTILLYLVFGSRAKYLDYAGGYGVFVRLMRDRGFDFYWDDKYTKNLFSVGFDKAEVSHFDAVTLFEVFEHLPRPMDELGDLFDMSKTLIISTELYPESMPEPNNWWYFGLDHGQHISFYTEKTFKFIAGNFGVNYYNCGMIHILTDKKIPKWKLLAQKLRHVGLDGLLSMKLKPKTWSDYKKMSMREKG
jgi:hypothetical protein